MSNNRSPVPFVVLAVGMIVSAWILGSYVYKARATSQYVTVKGLAEREVRADRASWSLIGTYGAKSNEQIQSLISMHTDAVQEFLTENGFEQSEYKVASVNVMRNAYQQAVDPFTVEVQVTLETGKIDKVQSASSQVADLIAKGVTLAGDQWRGAPRYYYTDFQSIKTEMLAEATRNAKLSAQEFAENSGSRVGKIKYANQGIFQLLPASRNNDNAEFHADKLVRVVTTVDYFLE